MARRTVYVVVETEFDGARAKKRLRDMEDRASDFGPVLKWGVNKLERAYSTNFTTMGLMSARAMLGGAWPPLDTEYASWKATKFPGAPMMVQTGELFRSVSNLSSSTKNEMTDMSATLVVDSPIAKFHQYGTRDMPARKIVFVPRDFDKEIGEKAAKYVVDGSKLT